MNKYIKKLPIGFSGVALGICGLANAWTILFQSLPNKQNNTSDLLTNHILQIILFIISFFIFLTLGYRFIKNKDLFNKEINDPLLASFIPTFAMTGMLIGGFLAGFWKLAYSVENAINFLTVMGAIIWYISIMLHLIFFIFFIKNVIKKHDFKNNDIYASWFVPPVGIIAACTVSGSFPVEIVPALFCRLIWWFGFSFYLITLPYFLYKIVYHDNIDHNKIPSLAIFGAPANLSFAGFLSIPSFSTYYGDQFYNSMCIILLILAVSTTLFLYVSLIKIFQTKFNPSYASLTFPTAIGAVALLKFANVAFINEFRLLISVIGYIELAISTLIIAYVFVMFLFSLRQWCSTKKQLNY